MADITPARENIDERLAKFNAALSEAFFFLVGGAINFINDRHFERHSWNLNGSTTLANTDGLDGMFVIPFDMEITALTMSLQTSGSSGSVTPDIHWFSDSGVDEGSIFSTRPAIASTAGDDAFLGRNLVTSNDKTGTGITLPVFSKTEFNEFDALKFNLDTTQVAARDLNVTIFFRPR